jgi:uncharacterized repeat protein (TIGR01451 family)
MARIDNGSVTVMDAGKRREKYPPDGEENGLPADGSGDPSGADGSIFRAEGRVRRRLALLVLLSVVTAILAATFMPAIAGAFSKKKVLDSTAADFTSGEYFRLVGIVEKGGIAGVQLLAVGLDLTRGWVTETTSSGQVEPVPYFPGVTDQAVASFGGKLIIAGGVYGAADYYSQHVHTATVSQTDNFADYLTPWVTQTAQLPAARSAAALAVSPTGTINDRAYLYLIGGYDGSRMYATTYRSIFTPTTGEVGPWQADLPVEWEDPGDEYGIQYHSAVVFGGRIYVIGGERKIWTGYNYSNVVYSAKIQGDGSLTATNSYGDPAWVVLTPTLPAGLANGAAVIYDGTISDTIYFIGGWNGSSASAQMYYTDILSDGSITQWYTSSANLPAPRQRHAAGFARGQIIVAGGASGSDLASTVTDTVMAAIVKEDEWGRRLVDFCKDADGNFVAGCELGSWLGGPLLPESRNSHAMAVSGNEFFVIGGTAGGNDKRRNTVYHGTADAEGGRYPPNGEYQSKVFNLGSLYGYQPQRITNLEWAATVPISSGLVIQYRVATNTDIHNVSWVTASGSISGLNTFTFTPPVTTTGGSKAELQYRAVFTSNYPYVLTSRMTTITVYADLLDPDLRVHKSVQPFAKSGETVIYTVYYSNTGHVEVAAVLSDTIPDYTIINDLNWTHSTGKTYTRTLGTVLPNPTGPPYTTTIVVNVEKDHTVTETITNTVQITYAEVLTDDRGNVVNDPTPGNNVYTASLVVRPVEITISKSADPYPVADAGALITYTLRITEVRGNDSATNVVITDTLADRLDFVSCTASCSKNGKTLTWDLGELPASDWDSVEFTARITNPLDSGVVITNTAYADCDQWPVVSAMVTVTVHSAPVLHIVKSAVPSPPGPVSRGNSIRYTLSYSNSGNMNAAGVVITDLIQTSAPPLDGVILSVSGAQAYNLTTGVITPSFSSFLGTYAYSGTLTTAFTITLKNDAPAGWITNTGYIRFATIFASSNGVSHNITTGDLLIGKSANPPAGTSVQRGSYITYTINITNNGDSSATSVAVADSLPLQTTYKWCVAPAGATCSNPTGSKVTWSVGSLNPHSSKAMSFAVQVITNAIAGSVIANDAYTVTGNLADSSYGPPVIHSVPAPSLYVSKDSDPLPGSSVLINSVIKYYVYHGNSSIGSALSTRITDVITGPVTFESSLNPDWTLASVSNVGGVTVTVVSISLGTYCGGSDPCTLKSPTVLYIRNVGTATGQVITNSAFLYSPDQSGGFATISGTNTITHSTTNCGDSLSTYPDLEVISWDYSGDVGRNRCVFADSNLTFPVTVKNNSPSVAAKSNIGSGYYGFTTEIHVVPDSYGPLNLTPAIHYFGYCPDGNPASSCNVNETGGRDSHYIDSPANGLAAGGTLNLTFSPAGARPLPSTGWWTIYIQPDKYWNTYPDSGNAAWGYINEGCWEGNNVKSLRIYVRPSSDKSLPECMTSGGPSGPYLPLILKNKTP